MKHWKHFTVAAIFAILLSSCTTTNISFIAPFKVADKVYTLCIPYNFSEESRIYAIRFFVQFMSYESYDAQLTRHPNPFGKNYYEYTITVPGSTPVVAVPENIKSGLKLDHLWFQYSDY